MTSIRVLEICPYEPPASGWVNRVKLLRRVISERNGQCEILDIGPSRTVERDGCICVYGASDYMKKVWRFAGDGFVLHNHVNGRYFRGILLAIAAQLIGRLRGCRCVTTFHAGLDQPFIQGWRRYAIWPFYRLLFAAGHAVVCNSEPVARRIAIYASPRKIRSIPAFSVQYMEFEAQQFDERTERFLNEHSPLVSTYICFRPGFYVETLLAGMRRAVDEQPGAGFAIVGTGDDRALFESSLESLELSDNVLLLGNLDHDEFLTLISRSDIHLRTPTSDGVSSTVLEALNLRVPVVAADNGTRPESVVTYTADDPAAMANAIASAVRSRAELVDAIPDGLVADTAAEEVDLLSER